MYKEEIFLIVPANHALASRDTVDLTELKSETFISYREDYGFREVTDNYCEGAGFLPNIAFEADEQFIINQLVDEEFGIAFFPALSYGEESLLNTKRLRFDPPLYRNVELAWRQGKRMTQTLKELKAYTIKYFSKIE